MSQGELERTPSDADRTRVIELLSVASGQIGLEEADRRMDLAVRAESMGELAMLVWDLPATSPPDKPPARKISIWKSATFRIHATVYGLVNAMLVGIWGVADPHAIFWPFFPIAGWGVGLGVHAVSTHSAQQHRQQKEARRAIRAVEKQAEAKTQAISQRSSAPTGSPGNMSRTSVAVMFADVVDSTRLTAVIGDEDWTRIRSKYRDLLRGCYEDHRGTDVSSQGDGFLARFQSPVDAVQCAMAIQTRLEDRRDETGFGPAVRIGINCGAAVDEDGDVLGTVVNVAARVTSQAGPHQIFITEAVADCLDDRFRVQDEGLRDLRGLGRSAHLISVAWRD